MPDDTPEPPRMTPDQLRAYAEYVINDHAFDIETLSIYELAESTDLVPGEFIHDDDVTAVRDLIRAATITITFGDDQ